MIWYVAACNVLSCYGLIYNFLPLVRQNQVKQNIWPCCV